MSALWLKQSTAVTVKVGPCVDSTDGNTDETGLTIQKADVRLAKNGGNMAAASANQGESDAGAAHDEIGYYDISLDTTDTGTLGTLDLMIHKSGALHAFKSFMVVPANVYDSVVGGSDYLDINIVQLAGSATAANTLAARNYIDPESRFVIVAQAATAADRGTALLAAYAAAKVLTPGGAALSATNRAKVLIPPGLYSTGASTLTCDTSYVDLEALFPEMGGARKVSDVDHVAGTSTGFRPPGTLIYSSSAGVTPVVQSADHVRMRGFGIAQLGAVNAASSYGLLVSISNPNSIYEEMYFWHDSPKVTADVRYPVGFSADVDGTWIKCICNTGGWRIPYDAGDAAQFKAHMYDIDCGAYSIIGDYLDGHKGTHKATNCRLERVTCRGWFDSAPSGYGGIAGCLSFGNDIDSGCVFIDCETGPHGFGIGCKSEALQIRCRGGYHSAGCTGDDDYPGEFAGIDIDGIWGESSLGGTAAGSTLGTLSGKVCGSRVIGSSRPHRLDGATIVGSLFTMASINQDAMTLIDSGSWIAGNYIFVKEGGEGIPINAASALNVTAIGNAYNNKAFATTGLGSNVTNVGTSDMASGSVGSVTAGVTVTTNSDKTGYSLAASQHVIVDSGTVTTVTNNVNAVLANTAHGGAGATITLQTPIVATISGTTTTLDALATSLNSTHGAGSWATATGFSTHSAADVKTAMEANGSKLDHLWETTEDNAGVRRFTEAALVEAPTGEGGGTEVNVSSEGTNIYSEER